MRATQRAGDLLMLALALLIFWQTVNAAVGSTALPGPAPTLAYLGDFVTTPRFLESAAATAVAFAYALVLAYGIGLAIGVWLGAHHIAGAVGEPILVAIYSMPKITLYPVVLLIFGLGISGKVAFGALHGILPVALLSMNAIRNVPPVYLKSARAMQLSTRALIAHVLLPSTLPEVVSGLRIGFTTTLLGVVLAEMFASKRGLGFLMINAISTVQPEEMLSVAIVLFFFAVLANALMLWSEHRLFARPQPAT
jgi:NitT/TauT family transport system permease protein